MTNASGVKPYADEWIADARSETRCEWCGEPERMPRIKLCQHCNRIRKKLEKTRQWVAKEKVNANKHKQFFLDFELAIIEEEKRSCISDGKRLKYLFEGVDSLDLESWLSWAANRIVSKSRLHSGIATRLGWTFTRSQQQVIAYLFWEIFHADARRNRWNRAVGEAGYK